MLVVLIPDDDSFTVPEFPEVKSMGEYLFSLDGCPVVAEVYPVAEVYTPVTGVYPPVAEVYFPVVEVYPPLVT